MHTLIMLIATGFYAGYLPKAPGTWGSLVGLLLFYLFRSLSLHVYLAVVAFLFVVGTLAAGEAEKIIDTRDPKIVVIDEIVGMLVTMTAVPASLLTMALGFILFRIFDIGNMLDDVVAGLYSLLVLHLIIFLIS